MADVQFMLDARESARRAGDLGLWRSLTADLTRIGYVDPPAGERVELPSGLETAAVRAPERVVPQAKPAAKRGKGGRPPLPRCEHGRIVGRCPKCNA